MSERFLTFCLQPRLHSSVGKRRSALQHLGNKLDRAAEVPWPNPDASMKGEVQLHALRKTDIAIAMSTRR